MEQIETQVKNPIRLTYRSTSTGPGKTEFMGNVTSPYTDFASGDTPLSGEQYETLTSAGVEVIHLPIVMGAIGMFHSAPQSESR